MAASGGLVLVVAAAAAVLLANSPLSGAYDALVHAELQLGVTSRLPSLAWLRR